MDKLGDKLLCSAETLFQEGSEYWLSGELSYDELLLRYVADTPVSRRKRLGQFFTPRPIAALMTNWIMEIAPASILDPAVGTGVFLAEFCRYGSDARFVAMDIDANILRYARTLAGRSNIEFVHGDFLRYHGHAFHDAIIANPPYLRHHDFNYEPDIFSEVGARNNISISRLTNIYGLFLLEICRLLKPGGRAAVIIPAEWTNANFGMPIKRFLLERGLLHTLLYFTHQALLFPDVLTTACVLLIEKPRVPCPRKFIRTFYLPETPDFELAWDSIRNGSRVSGSMIIRDIASETLSASPRWNHLLCGLAADPEPGLVPLRKLASTRRGIATGANAFFHLDLQSAQKLGIQLGSLTPCIGRAADAAGLIFDRADFDALVSKGRRTHLLDIKGSPDAAETAYLAQGVRRQLPDRYLLAARRKWYAVETCPPAPVWAAVFGRAGLRFLRNRAGVRNLTVFHCIYPFNPSPVFADALTVCLNSRRMQERAWRFYRVYGGGLLKMEPRDLLEMEVPDLSLADNQSLSELAGLLPEMDAVARRRETPTAAQDERIDKAVNAVVRMARVARQEVLPDEQAGARPGARFPPSLLS